MSHTRLMSGFTLAELLISMAVLAIIFTFTMSKVLYAQKAQQNIAGIKQNLAAVSEAYQLYKLNNNVDSNTGMADLTPYLNYVKVDTVSAIDYAPCASSTSCAIGSYDCLKMHDGSVLFYTHNMKFGGTGSLNALKFAIDPDGVVTNGAGDAGKAVTGYVYVNGGLRTRIDIFTGTTNSIVTDNPNPSCEPSWFSWN